MIRRSCYLLSVATSYVPLLLLTASAWNQGLAKQVLARSTDTQVLASCFLGAWRATCKYLGLTLLDYVRCTMFKRGYSGNNIEHPAACCNK